MSNYTFYEIVETVSGVRVVQVGNQKMYFAKDAVKVLGFRNYKKTINFYCNARVGRYDVVCPGEGPRSMALIDKNTMNVLIDNSDKQSTAEIILLRDYVNK